ncbi:hypothetical protein BCV70DRAFT_164358 [Testicularia cyperi]|uniref:Uncharacterized protein n=1 Tax=Testicularia cyperi TaxID=1882483 RepID=A0A317XLL2_9BASI|nr:hypothetical protein BCV70DRAFT_164358 [Testicularia cyperi]
MNEFVPSVNWDSHTTAMLFGVVMGEFFSYLSFDIRLVRAIIRQRRFHPMPAAYLIARYVMVWGVSMIALSTIQVYRGEHANVTAVHWLRAMLMPVSLTATSAILGFRALVLHHDRPRLVSKLIYTLLTVQYVGATTVLVLNMIDMRDKVDTIVIFLPGVWIVAPLGIGMLFDTVFCLLVVVPILKRGERLRRGQVMHLLFSDALFFGAISLLVKAVAIAFTVVTRPKRTDSFIAIRFEIVVCTIFACRIFRGQETFLREHQHQTAHPSLGDVQIQTSRAFDHIRQQTIRDMEAHDSHMHHDMDDLDRVDIGDGDVHGHSGSYLQERHRQRGNDTEKGSTASLTAVSSNRTDKEVQTRLESESTDCAVLQGPPLPPKSTTPIEVVQLPAPALTSSTSLPILVICSASEQTDVTIRDRTRLDAAAPHSEEPEVPSWELYR